MTTSTNKCNVEPLAKLINEHPELLVIPLILRRQTMY